MSGVLYYFLIPFLHRAFYQGPREGTSHELMPGVILTLLVVSGVIHYPTDAIEIVRFSEG
jgi:hypothetical protein